MTFAVRKSMFHFSVGILHDCNRRIFLYSCILYRHYIEGHSERLRHLQELFHG